MARYRRSTNDLDDDLAYGDLPPLNRWDRSRLDRELRERERQRTQVLVDDSPRDRGRFEERRYYESRSPEPRFASRVRREIYEERPVEHDRALQPYERERERDIIIDIERGERPAPPRPGLLRRQSSLDTFDRPTARYGREIDVYRRPPSPRRVYREEERRPQEQEYREVEIYRERDVRRGRAKSDLRSVVSDAKSAASKHSHHSHHSHHSSHHSHHSEASSTSRASSPSRSPSPARLPGKKGHTKLPKPQFKKAAIERFGVPFVEEEDRFRILRALEKPMIDQILQWSREMKEPRVTTYKYDDDGSVKNDHYEAIRTEWINPPSVRGAPSVRAPSPARSHRTVRAHSPKPPPPPAPPVEQRREEIRVTIPEKQPAPPVIIQAPPQPQWVQPPPPLQPMTVAIQQQPERSHQDIEDEIRRLQIERDLVRIERGGNPYHGPGPEMIVPQPMQPYPPAPGASYQVVPYRPRSKSRGRPEVIYIEGGRASSPKREVVRIEKDRKDKKPNPKIIAGMMSILT